MKEYRIHPAIGIARVGNSELLNDAGFFIGPESPGEIPNHHSSYRDQSTGRRLKRQAARFRIYEYECNKSGEMVATREITADDAKIEWCVEIANTKGTAQHTPPSSPRTPEKRRNEGTDARFLNIKPPPATISGRSKHSAYLEDEFMGTPVRLGQLFTDGRGRLVVSGGYGKSFSPTFEPLPPVNSNSQLEILNAAEWCDDTSDGKITAEITFHDKGVIEAKSAWVIVGPPDHAPPIHNLISLYDVVLDVANQIKKDCAIPKKISFTKHIFPIFLRTTRLEWVSKNVRESHGDGTMWNFLEPSVLAQLASKSVQTEPLRTKVFENLRDPDNPSSSGKMPVLSGGVDPENTRYGIETTLTRLQYALLIFWREGKFLSDWKDNIPRPQSLSSLPVKDQPSALDRAALDACVGYPFHPGIEVSWRIAQKKTFEQNFEAPGFRLSSSVRPGDLTADLAVPWQGDFSICSGNGGWPGQRPGCVRVDDVQKKWERGIKRDEDMVEDWWKLGFVVQEGDKFVEKERILPEP